MYLPSLMDLGMDVCYMSWVVLQYCIGAHIRQRSSQTDHHQFACLNTGEIHIQLHITEARAYFNSILTPFNDHWVLLPQNKV